MWRGVFQEDWILSLIPKSQWSVNSVFRLVFDIIVVAMYSNDAAQQGRPESIRWRLWQPLYGPCVTLEHSLQPAGIRCMLVFAEGGKPENPEKNPLSREENQHKLNPLMASNPGHTGGRRVLSPLRHPCSHRFPHR